MKNLGFTILMILTGLCGFSQEETPYKVVDTLFREDQFYTSISYNLVQNRPSGFKQFSFSPSYTVGFLRDMPFSKNRHWAFALGFGYNYNNIKQFINADDVFDSGDPNNNIRTWITTHCVDIPLEIRWRDASPVNHKFWRIYSGFKLSYTLSAKAKAQYTAPPYEEVLNILNDVNRLYYGVYVAMGYNTWNFYCYYSLMPVFKDGLYLSHLNVGLKFYIL